MADPKSITTARLLLRPWTRADSAALREALDESEGHLRPWIPFMKDEPRSLEATEAWVDQIIAAHNEGSALRFGVWQQARLLGEVMLIDRVGPRALELGYWLRKTAVGQGAATEASEALVAYAFERRDVDRVRLVLDEGNGPSRGVAERLGARLVGKEPPLEFWDIVQ